MINGYHLFNWLFYYNGVKIMKKYKDNFIILLYPGNRDVGLK